MPETETLVDGYAVVSFRGGPSQDLQRLESSSSLSVALFVVGGFLRICDDL